MIFDLIEKLYNNCEAEIFFYLHKYFDPVQVQEMTNNSQIEIIENK